MAQSHSRVSPCRKCKKREPINVEGLCAKCAKGAKGGKGGKGN